MTRQGRAPLRPPVPRGWKRYDDRSKPVRSQGPAETALAHCRRVGRSEADTAWFMVVFDQVREMVSGGQDPEVILREILAMSSPNRETGEAAYIEALASTRKPGYAE